MTESEGLAFPAGEAGVSISRESAFNNYSMGLRRAHPAICLDLARHRALAKHPWRPATCDDAILPV
jgi:hypothetical protein